MSQGELVAENERKRLEAEFHSQREKDRLNLSEKEFLARYPNKKIYAIDRGPKEYLWNWLAERCSGKVVLDYCCGLGATTVKLAELGADAHGIDISEDEVATARQRAKDAGVDDRTTISVMDAEKMTYPDDTFDIIVCTGVLHHLELRNAYPELARVLKPTGKVIAVEALGYNPFIQLYRRMTPQLRTAWETDHILTLKQVNQGLRFFVDVNVVYFHLFTLLAIPFQRFGFFKSMLGFLEFIDKLVLRIPGVRRMAWQMVFVFSSPK